MTSKKFDYIHGFSKAIRNSDPKKSHHMGDQFIVAYMEAIEK
jgi:hypothetical protein